MLLFVYHSVVIHSLGNSVAYVGYVFNHSTILAFKKDIESSTKGNKERRVIHIHVHERSSFFDRHRRDTDTNSDTEGTKPSDSD